MTIDSGNPNYLEDLSQCHFFHYKFDMNCSGTEPGLSSEKPLNCLSNGMIETLSIKIISFDVVEPKFYCGKLRETFLLICNPIFLVHRYGEISVKSSVI
jgi:hypothetical protein